MKFLSWLRPARAIYFQHIPKTAGTSLIRLLDQVFPAEEVCPAHLWSMLLRLPREGLRRYKLFRGHFYHHLHTYAPVKLTTFTFLRDPVERSLSHYEHILRDRGHYFHERANRQGSLAAFLRDPQTAAMITNFQTRGLGVDLDPVRIALTLDSEALGRAELERRLESVLSQGETEAQLLARALARLRRMAFVGLVERYDESVRALFQTLGWKPVREVPRLNVSSNRLERRKLTSEERRLLEEHTRLDRALYEAATALFTGVAGRRRCP
jgi:hypothetical protein